MSWLSNLIDNMDSSYTSQGFKIPNIKGLSWVSDTAKTLYQTYEIMSFDIVGYLLHQVFDYNSPTVDFPLYSLEYEYISESPSIQIDPSGVSYSYAYIGSGQVIPTLHINSSIQSRIDYGIHDGADYSTLDGDIDCFAISLNAGDIIQFDLKRYSPNGILVNDTSQPNNHPLDPFLEINWFDPTAGTFGNGLMKTMVSNDNTSYQRTDGSYGYSYDSKIVYEVPYTSTYWITVAGASDYYGLNRQSYGDYILSAQQLGKDGFLWSTPANLSQKLASAAIDIVRDGSSDSFQFANLAHKINFQTDVESDVTVTLTGLDQSTMVWLWNYQGLIPRMEGFTVGTNNTLSWTLHGVDSGQLELHISPLNDNTVFPFGGVTNDPNNDPYTYNLTYTITRTNHAPVFQGSTNLTAQENHTTEYNYGNAFYDRDIANGDSINFSITQANGSALPAWMQVNTTTKTITATPPTGAEDVTLHIAATDEAGVTASADIAFNTPSPTDNAGNTIETAKSIGTLTFDSFKTYSDYVGIDDDGYDYYSFSTSSTSIISVAVSNIKNGTDLNATLLAADGSVIQESTFDSSISSEKIDSASLAAGNYIVRVNATTGHSDYNFAVRSSALDMGGSFSNPKVISLAQGQHYYNLNDYLSAIDTSDAYQINLDATAWIQVYGLDSGSQGWHGSLSGSSNGNAIYISNSPYWEGQLSSGNCAISLAPATWQGSYQQWVSTGWGTGYYNTVYYPVTYTGFNYTGILVDRLPTVANAIPDQTVAVSQSFSFTVANNTFQDLDNDPLVSITATLADGSALPSWLVFDSSTLTFSGQLENLVNSIFVKLTALFVPYEGSFSSGHFDALKATDTFIITPIVIDGVGNSTATAQVVNVGSQTTVTPILSSTGDDYFALQLDHNAPIAIRFDNVPTDAHFTLLAADGTELQTADDGTLQLVTSSLTTGQYFLHLQSSINPKGYSLIIDGDYVLVPPSQPDLVLASDSGINNDNITSNSKIILSGTADANTTVRLFDGDIPVGYTDSDDTGNWSFNTTFLADGYHAFSSKLVDINGFESESSNALSVTIDTLPPVTLSTPQLVAIYGTNNAQIPTLSGSTEALATISIYDNGLLLGTTISDISGVWHFAIPTLPTGEHSLGTTVSDLAGNFSEESALAITTLDNLTKQVTSNATQIFLGNGDLNTLSFSGSTAAATVNLALTTFQNTGFGSKQLIGIESIIGGSFADTLLGNESSNGLTGGAGADYLSGNAGYDTLIGGAGSDTINGGAGSDTIDGGDGIDTADYNSATGAITVKLTSTIAQTIGGGMGVDTLLNIESLIGGNFSDKLIGNASTNNIQGLTGADTIYGGADNDTLDGGTGADKLYGGAGNDTYYVNSRYDAVTESTLATGGIDTVYSSDSYSLTPLARAGVENLTLTGTAAINGVGNAKANILIGNDAANRLGGGYGKDTLDGGNGNDILNGGYGQDVLTGSNGSDIFRLTNFSKDTITDFVVVDDTIQLENAVFTKLGAVGTLNSTKFIIGTSALDNNDCLIYDSTSGVLWYDANGSLAGGAVQIAVLGTGLVLTNADFVVI
jgi:Ca2+-binding RTX toxin-like protein